MEQARRVTRELSDSEKQRLAQHQAQIASELPDMIERDQMRKEARDEQTLSGEFRRAIHRSELPLSTIAERAGLPLIALDEFLTGERTLRSDVMDRLAQVLEYPLTQPS